MDSNHYTDDDGNDCNNKEMNLIIMIISDKIFIIKGYGEVGKERESE